MDSSAHKHPPAFAVTIHNYDYPSKSFPVDQHDREVIVVDPPRERATDNWSQSSDDIDFYTALVEPMPGTAPTLKNRRSLQLLMHTLLPHSSDSRSRDEAGYASTSSTSSSVLSPTDSYFASPGASSTTTTSPRDSPPLDFLLDDDPFANLSSPPPRKKSSTSVTLPTPLRLAPSPAAPELKPVAPPPRSPLMPLDGEIPKKSLPRANSSECTSPNSTSFSGVPPPRRGRERAISGAKTPLPAYQRPAFTPRPSLPSLSTLAKMNVVLTKKVRKGRVGAGLPFEPWDTLESNEEEDEEGERQPTRVLQDVNGKETASLPAGMQPLLPSQLLQMSTSSSSAAYVSHQSSISTPSLPVATTNIAAAALNPAQGFRSSSNDQAQSHTRPQLAISTSSPLPSSTHVTECPVADEESREISPTGSSEGGDLVDSYYSTLLDDEDGEGSYALHESPEQEVGAPRFIRPDDPLFSPLSSSALDLELSPTTANFPSLVTSPTKLPLPISPPASSSSSTSPRSQTSLVISTSTTSFQALDSAVHPDAASFDDSEDLPPAKAYHLEESAWYKGSPVSSPSKSNCALASPARSPAASSCSSPVKDGFTSFARALSDESYSSGESFGEGCGSRRSAAPSSMITRSSSEDSSSASSSLSDPLASPPESMVGDAVYGWLPQPNYTPFNFKSVSYFPPYAPSSSSLDESLSRPAAGEQNDSTERVASWRNSSQPTAPVPGTSYLSDLDLSDADMPASSSSSHEGPSKGYGMYGYAGKDLEGSLPSSADTIRPPRVVDDAQSRRVRRSMLFSGVVGSGSDEEDFGDRMDMGVHRYAGWEDGYDGVHVRRRVDEEDSYDSSLSSGSSQSGSNVESSRSEEGTEEDADEFFDAIDSPPIRDSFTSTMGLEDGEEGKGPVEPLSSPGIDRDGDDHRVWLGNLLNANNDANQSDAALRRLGSAASSSSSSALEQRPLDSDHHNQEQHSASLQQNNNTFNTTNDEQEMRFRTGDVQKGESARREMNGSEMVDGSGREGGNVGGEYRGWTSSSREQGGGHGAPASYSSKSNGGRMWGSGGHGGDDEEDGRDDRRRRAHRNAPDSRSSTATSEDDEDGERDDGGRRRTQSKSTAQFPSSATPQPSSSAAASDDDDVPLAQRIPTALKAQKSIRKQVREERLQRRATRNRTQPMGESSDSGAIKERERLATLRPSGAGGPLLPPTSSAMSSSVEAAMLAASGGASTAPVRRQRGLTLPSQAAPPPISTQPFSAEDLSRRLQSVRVSSDHPNHQPIPSSGASRGPPPPYEQHSGAQTTRSRPSLDDRTPVSSVPSSALPDHQRKEFGPSPISPNTSTTRGLRPMRSFHRAERRPVTDGYEAPAPVATTLSRQPTSARAPPISQTRSRGESVSAAQSPAGRYRSLSVSRGGHSSAHAHPSSAYDEFGVPHPPVPPLPELSHAPSRRVKPHTTSGRPSMENERPLTSRPSTSTRAPPVPLSASAVDKAVVVQQRVFIGDMQKFNMVEISSSTTAGDVIELLDEQGALKGIIGTGGWMVWEVAQDFGMERPIRSFEILFDIQASWNKDKSTNMFVLKLTPLSATLSRSAIPGFAPIHSGYVEWESKKGKWSKRWMELREHCIWLSKREGKDEVMLCSLSSFDAYSLTRTHRSPKPFTFAVKSTDNLSYFENTADYLHMFSCSERDGRAWMEKILVARSYVLHQERQVLFNPKVPGGNAASTALSRSGTTARRPAASRPAQPLISIPAPFNAQPTNATVFEPGSLLHKQP